MSRPQVVVRFHGRLGNQLFQWAVGVSLAGRRGADLWFDWPEGDRPEILELVNLKRASAEIVATTKGGSGPGDLFRRAVIRLLPAHRRPYLSQKGQGVTSALLKGRGSVYLDGYWQSPTYFPGLVPYGVGPLLHRLWELCRNDPWLDRARESVVIHVRRTDYGGEFPRLSREYYERAMCHFPDLPALVVSDDPLGASQFLEGLPVTVVTDTGRTLYQDLGLMTRAAGVVIANSTFSWWGAYLNIRTGVRVVAPSVWFGTPPAWKDLYPTHWTVL